MAQTASEGLVANLVFPSARALPHTLQRFSTRPRNANLGDFDVDSLRGDLFKLIRFHPQQLVPGAADPIGQRILEDPGELCPPHHAKRNPIPRQTVRLTHTWISFAARTVIFLCCCSRRGEREREPSNDVHLNILCVGGGDTRSG